MNRAATCTGVGSASSGESDASGFRQPLSACGDLFSWTGLMGDYWDGQDGAQDVQDKIGELGRGGYPGHPVVIPDIRIRTGTGREHRGNPTRAGTGACPYGTVRNEYGRQPNCRGNPPWLPCSRLHRTWVFPRFPCAFNGNWFSHRICIFPASAVAPPRPFAWIGKSGAKWETEEIANTEATPPGQARGPAPTGRYDTDTTGTQTIVGATPRGCPVQRSCTLSPQKMIWLTRLLTPFLFPHI